jgi:phosphoglycerol transferase
MKRYCEALFAGAAMVLALALAAVVLELWNADLRAPFAYTGDATLNLLFIKDVLENPWHFENPSLGAPNDLELYDYPVIDGETLNLLLFRVLGVGTSDPALVMNLFFLLTFPLVALTAYIVLRRLPVSRGIALVVALLYALLPYHFQRGEVHLFLAAYYAVPLGAYLALAVFRGDNLFGRWRPLLTTAVMCAVVATASGSGYYAVFTVLLVAVAALLAFLIRRERAALVAGGAVVAAIAAVFLLQLAPTLVYRAVNGTNDEVAKRYWFESENYSLRLTNLLLPVDGHRIDAFARWKDEYTAQIPQTEARSATLGVVASIGFIWLVAVAVAAAAGAGRRYRFGLHAGLAVLTVVAVLIATTGGFSTFLAVVWPQIRAWNRLSVFIAFFSLAAVALLLGQLERRVRTPVFAALLAGLLALGVYDQTTKAYVPAYDAVEAAWEEDDAFFSRLDDRLPDDAMVVQVPYEPFPEPPQPTFMGGYEPAKAYLHSDDDDLRWSWGAMKGRPEDWAATIQGKPAAEVVSAARREGFTAILLDRAALGGAAAATEAEFRAAVGSDPVEASGRYVVFRI